MRRLPNIQRHLKAECQILNVLASADGPVGFNELQRKSSVSSKTLAEQLRNLVPVIARKVGGKYIITDAGRQRVRIIEQDLEKWSKGGMRRFRAEAVEVYSMGPEHYCKGMVKVSSLRRLEWQERRILDRAIIDAIRRFGSIVPRDCRSWRVSIYSHSSSKS